MAVTIKDVAKRANVAPSTVSRVISDNPAISDATKEKVRQVMDEMNYRPNVNARNLVSQKANAIGIVIPSENEDFYENPFFLTALRGINDVAVEGGYSILLSIGDGIEERFKHVQQLVFEKRVDGLIFLYANEEDPIMKFARKEKVPFTVIGSIDHPDINYVDNNNYQAGKIVANQLTEMGYKKFHILGGNTEFRHITDRERGIRDHIASDIVLTVDNDIGFTMEDGYNTYEKIADLDKDTALIVTDETIADGLILASCRISNTFPIITYRTTGQHAFSFIDDNSYVDLNTVELGVQAMQNLEKQLLNNEIVPEQKFVDVSWVEVSS